MPGERQLWLDLEPPPETPASVATVAPEQQETRSRVADVVASPNDEQTSNGAGECEQPKPPYTLEQFQRFCEARAEQLPGVDAWQEEYRWLRASKGEFIDDLVARHKAPALKQLALRCGSFDSARNNKQQNAEAVYRACMQGFILGNSFQYDPMAETVEEASDRIVLGYTAEDFAAYDAERDRKRQQHKQAIENPQNLADYALLVREMGEHHLSDEQHLHRDRLYADLSRKTRRERQGTTVEQFSADGLEGLEFTIKEGYHDKRQCELWIVQLSTRVDRAAFSELKAKAKQLGGWYSSFKKADAGFQFLTEEAAHKFAGLQEGSADRSDELEDRRIRKLDNAAERFVAMADRLTEQSQQTLEADETKLKNTVRRADMAASVRSRAFADLATAKTLRSLATHMQEGDATYLDGIRYAVQIETLRSLLSRAKWDHVRNQMTNEHGDLSSYSRSRKQDELEQRPVDASDVRFAEYPKPYLYRDHLDRAMAQLGGTKGIMQATAKLRKIVGRSPREQDYVEFNNDHDIAVLEDFLSRAKAANYDCYWFEHCLDSYKRLQAADIRDGHELRAALAELLPHLKAADGDDPVTVAVDELRGKKLPGFFPTPRPVIHQLLDHADIQGSDRVLEPSAGMGDIMDLIRQRHPDVDLTAIEQNRTLSDVLVAKGYEDIVEFGDFLEQQGSYDKVVMNPPFEKGADIEHVQHAYELLNPGGRLVSVMSQGPFFREDQKSRLFRAWLEEIDGDIEDLPDDAFQGVESFRQTGVRTCVVILHKPDAQS